MLRESYIHPYAANDGSPSHCHVAIYDHMGKTIVVCSETLQNEGTSVTNAAEEIATAIWRDVGTPVLSLFVWIERYPAEPEAARQSGFEYLANERFARVTFTSLRQAGQGLVLRSPEWSHLDLAKIEELIGQSWEAPDV